MASLTATTAGNVASMVSLPTSVSRSTTTLPSPRVSLLACDTNGRASRSATAAQRTAPPPSEVC